MSVIDFPPGPRPGVLTFLSRPVCRDPGAPIRRASYSFIPLVLLFLLLPPLVMPAFFAAAASDPAVVYLSGDDTIPEGTEFREGDEIVTATGAVVRLPDGSDLELAEKTTVKIARMTSSGSTVVTTIDLSRGSMRARVNSNAPRRSVFTIRTPSATAGVRGTDFAVAYDPASATATVADDGNAEIDVFEGEVEVTRGGLLERVKAGRGASIGRRGIRARAIESRIQERWQERREEVVNRARKRLNLGENDDLFEALQSRLKNLSPEQRNEIRERTRSRVQEIRARAAAARSRREERRETPRSATPARRPLRRR